MKIETNIKNAMQYSSKLKNIIVIIQNSLGINSSGLLAYNESSVDNEQSYPQLRNGMYKITVNHKMSFIGGVDKQLLLESKNEISKIPVKQRINILLDLISERQKIDYLIEETKNKSKFEDAFSKEEVTYDFGCQIQRVYRELKDMLVSLIESEKEISTTISLESQTILENGQILKQKYPVEIKADSTLDYKNLQELNKEINEKIEKNSNALSYIEITSKISFEPKFSLNPTLKDVLSHYIDK